MDPHSGRQHRKTFDDGDTGGYIGPRIHSRMEVFDADGARVGIVECVEGDRIRLASVDPESHQPEYLPLGVVAGVEGDRVYLRGRGDNAFGMEAQH
jgi:hypothetical protein